MRDFVVELRLLRLARRGVWPWLSLTPAEIDQSGRWPSSRLRRCRRNPADRRAGRAKSCIALSSPARRSPLATLKPMSIVVSAMAAPVEKCSAKGPRFQLPLGQTHLTMHLVANHMLAARHGGSSRPQPSWSRLGGILGQPILEPPTLTALPLLDNEAHGGTRAALVPNKGVCVLPGSRLIVRARQTRHRVDRPVGRADHSVECLSLNSRCRGLGRQQVGDAHHLVRISAGVARTHCSSRWWPTAAPAVQD